MFNQLVYNALVPKKEWGEREVSIKYGELFLHDGEQKTATIEYLNWKTINREQEQISKDEGVFYGQKKWVKTILIKWRITWETRTELLRKIEEMKAKLAKDKKEILQVKEWDWIRERDCVVDKFRLNEHHWNVNRMERELQLLSYSYARESMPRVIEISIDKDETIIPIERGWTAPTQLGWIYSITQAGEKFKIEVGNQELLVKKAFASGDMMQLKNKNLTLNGDRIWFVGVYPKLEQEHESLKIITKTRGKFQIFYFLSYE